MAGHLGSILRHFQISGGICEDLLLVSLLVLSAALKAFWLMYW